MMELSLQQVYPRVSIVDMDRLDHALVRGRDALTPPKDVTVVKSSAMI